MPLYRNFPLFLLLILGVSIVGCNAHTHTYTIKFKAPRHKKAASAESPRKSRHADKLESKNDLPKPIIQDDDISEKAPKRKLHPLGLTSVLLPILALLFTFSGVWFLYLLGLMFAIASMVFGLSSVAAISKNKEKFWGKGFGITGFILGLLVLSFVLLSFIILVIIMG